MKFSGHLTLEIVDEITGKVIKTIEQDNIITETAYSSQSIIQSNRWPANNIFISPETATPIRNKSSITVTGFAYQGSGQPPIQAFHNFNPPYFVITQRLDAVTTARTFQTVGLTNGTGGQVVNTTATPFAYLLLNQPCIQEVNQILNLTYRITVNNPTPTPNLAVSPYPRWINDICRGLVDVNIAFSSIALYTRLHNTAANTPLKDYGWRTLYVAERIPSLLQSNGNEGLNASTSDYALFYRYRQYWDYLRTNGNGGSGSNGRVLNGILIGTNSAKRAANTNTVEADPGNTRSAYGSFQALGYNQTVNLQSAFSYSSNPRDDVGPMFLPDNNPSGTGIVQFSEDPWTGTWPTIYRIKITESGPVGTAKFVLGVKQFTSFNADGNAGLTFANNIGSAHPYIVSSIQPYAGAHGWQLPMPILAWDNNWTVQADNTGVSIINQFTGQHYDLDATTTPALPITAFRQMAFDQANNFIYIACSATGLWRLNVANKAAIVVTNLSTSPTYAVDVDAAGVIYVFMNKTASTLILTSSASNYVTDLGFTTVALTTANRLNIYVNKIHPDTRIAIAVRNGTITSGLNGATMYWWSLAVGNQGSFTTNLEYCGESQCSFAWVRNSDTRIWSGTAVLLVFGTDTAIGSRTSNTNPAPSNSFGAEYDPENLRLLNGSLISYANGDRVNVNVAQDNWGNMIPPGSNTSLFNPSTGVAFGSYNTQSIIKIKQVDMLNGIVLSEVAQAYLGNNGMNNDDSKWIWYKWNGTNWVKAVNYNITTNIYTNTTGTDTRTTSNSFIDLLDGINIRFTNGVTGTSFITNEVYDQYVCKGVLKTNDTAVYLENSFFYTQPLYEKITLTPTVITAPNNHGIVVDGAPGNTSLSAAVSATTVNPLWHALLPEAYVNTMQFFIDGVLINNTYNTTNHFCEGRNTLPSQASLTIGQCISYRNGLVLFSTTDVGKTVTGYFSYVAKSN